MQISAIALQGMQQAEARVEVSAQRLAGTADPGDTTDLSQEAVALLQARNSFAANVQVAKIANEMEKRTVDLLA